jgi:hypothetical protein
VSFTEKINVIIDVTTDKATAGIKGFKSAVSDAEGFTGKLKAGVGSLGEQFRKAAANPAVMASAVAGAGAAAFAAVNEFVDLGVQVGKFSDATGLANEDASRWIEVAGDIGIEAGSLESAIGKLNKSIDPELFKDLGIEIAKTADGATDVNGTFLNVIDRLKGIKDPAEKARMASKLLGKGWQDMAELIGLGSGALKKSLDGVADAKVIDPAEVEKARKFREAMDNLNDKFQEMVLTIGESLLPALQKVVDTAAKMGETAEPTIPILSSLGDVLTEVGSWSPTTDPIGFFNNLKDIALDVEEQAKDTGTEITYLGDANKEAAQQTYLHTKQQEAAADAADVLARKLDAERAAIQKVLDTISNRQSLLDVQKDVQTLDTRLGELKASYEAGDITAEEYWFATQGMVLDTEANVASYLDKLTNAPAQVITNVTAAVEAGDLDRAMELINHWASLDGKSITLWTNAMTQAGWVNGSKTPIKAGSKFASGTPSAPGGLALVGENGPELVNMPQGAQVFPAAQTAGMLRGGGGGGVTINALTADPRLIVEAIKKYQRRGGVL